MARVYVPLLNESVEVWRPVEAAPVGNGLYRLTGHQPDDEQWAFGRGEVVRCRWQIVGEDEVLVAYEKPP